MSRFARTRPGRRTSGAAAGLALAALAWGLTPTAPAVAAAPAAIQPCETAASDANCTGQSPGQHQASSHCWRDAYPLPKGDDFEIAQYDAGGTEYEVELWWSPACQSNWAVATGELRSGNILRTFSTKVRRFPSDLDHLGYVMEHGPTVRVPATGFVEVVSPMVYAPTNDTQACVSLPPFTGDADQAVCTDQL
jgi:hypothetical protein